MVSTYRCIEFQIDVTVALLLLTLNRSNMRLLLSLLEPRTALNDCMRLPRRTLEVVALAVVTGSIWLGISYGSPCYPLPPPPLQVALQPQPVPQSITILLPFDTFPRLWCPAGYYSAFGQVSCPTLAASSVRVCMQTSNVKRLQHYILNVVDDIVLCSKQLGQVGQHTRCMSLILCMRNILLSGWAHYDCHVESDSQTLCMLPN